MVIEFECRKCKTIFSYAQYVQNKFCPKCGTLLRERIIIHPVKSETCFEPIVIDASNINLDSLFFKFNKCSPIDVGGGIVFSSVDSWVSARKQAYKNFRDKFSAEKLLDFDYLSRVFKNWLLFRNNLSWTTLQRSGYKALDEPNRLAELILLLRDDDLDVGTRVLRGLIGKEKVNGIGQGILSALLHTFFDDKYCVWNSRTQDSLRILGCSPSKSCSNIGETYKEINANLHELAKGLNTDLTTIDGFVWFISKKGIFR